MNNVAPGWYPDPHNPTLQQRYWDGVQWTPHVAPVTPAAPVAPAGMAAASPAVPRSPLGTPLPSQPGAVQPGAVQPAPMFPGPGSLAASTTSPTSAGSPTTRIWGLWVVAVGLGLLVVGAIVASVISSRRENAVEPFVALTQPPFAVETTPDFTLPPAPTFPEGLPTFPEGLPTLPELPETPTAETPFTEPIQADSAPGTASIGSFPAGVYLVGQDIAPGMYRSIGGNECYWARYVGEDLQGNDSANGPTLFIVLPTDTSIRIQCDKPFVAVDPLKLREIDTITDGTWLVGIEVSPGTYRANGAQGCYWATFTKTNELIANGSAELAQQFTLQGNEFYVQIDCETPYAKQ